MFNIYDRYFVKPGDSGAPALTRNEQNLFQGLTQERVWMLARVKEEQSRAEGAEATLAAEIKKMHTYKLQAVKFGGAWDVDSWSDSVTIYNGGQIVTVIAVPPMPPLYEERDEMSISFFNPDTAMPYWLRFTRNDRGQMVPTGIYKPAFDTAIYSIAVSTKKLPWVLT